MDIIQFLFVIALLIPFFFFIFFIFKKLVKEYNIKIKLERKLKTDSAINGAKTIPNKINVLASDKEKPRVKKKEQKTKKSIDKINSKKNVKHKEIRTAKFEAKTVKAETSIKKKKKKKKSSRGRVEHHEKSKYQ